MEREILFRGKSLDNNKWFYGNYIEKIKPTEKEPTFLTCFIQDKAISMYEVKRETVGQFSGECDRDKTKIYEGDLFKIGAEKQIFEVKFHAGCFLAYAGDKQWGLLGELKMCFLKITGNIYDNPELIK